MATGEHSTQDHVLLLQHYSPWAGIPTAATTSLSTGKTLNASVFATEKPAGEG